MPHLIMAFIGGFYKRSFCSILFKLESIESQVEVQEKFNTGNLANVLLAPEPDPAYC